MFGKITTNGDGHATNGKLPLLASLPNLPIATSTHDLPCSPYGILNFSKQSEIQKKLLPNFEAIYKIIDTDIFQRLRNIGQYSSLQYVADTGNRSRFEHSIGTAHVTLKILEKLYQNSSDEKTRQIICENSEATILAGLLHDLGHLALSHGFYQVFFPFKPDVHEKITLFFIEKLASDFCHDPETQALILKAYGLLSDDPMYKVPKIFKQIIFSTAFNADRLDFLNRDTTSLTTDKQVELNNHINTLIENYSVSKDLELVLHTKATESYIYLAKLTEKMYCDAYQSTNGIILTAIQRALIERARDIANNITADRPRMYCDEKMHLLLATDEPESLLEFSDHTLLTMTDDWLNFHITAWANSNDNLLPELATLVLKRSTDRFMHRPIKSFSIDELELLRRYHQEQCVPKYYIQIIETKNPFQKDLTSKAPLIQTGIGIITGAIHFNTFLPKNQSSTNYYLIFNRDMTANFI